MKSTIAPTFSKKVRNDFEIKNTNPGPGSYKISSLFE